MKKAVFIILLCGFILSADNSFSFLNEPVGYDGYEWGCELNAYIATSGRKNLTKKGALYYGALINEVEVDIGYEFFKDKFYGVIINFPPDKRDVIVNYFISKHGKPTKDDKKQTSWLGVNTNIVVKEKDAEVVSIELEKEYLKEKGNKSSK